MEILLIFAGKDAYNSEQVFNSYCRSCQESVAGVFGETAREPRQNSMQLVPEFSEYSLNLKVLGCPQHPKISEIPRRDRTYTRAVKAGLWTTLVWSLTWMSSLSLRPWRCPSGFSKRSQVTQRGAAATQATCRRGTVEAQKKHHSVVQLVQCIHLKQYCIYVVYTYYTHILYLDIICICPHMSHLNASIDIDTNHQPFLGQNRPQNDGKLSSIRI